MSDIVKVKIKELNYNKKLPLEYEISTKSGGREKNGFWGKISNILLFLFGIKILNYNWEKLEKSLVEEGYNTSKYGYIEDVFIKTPDYDSKKVKQEFGVQDQVNSRYLMVITGFSYYKSYMVMNMK